MGSSRKSFCFLPAALGYRGLPGVSRDFSLGDAARLLRNLYAGDELIAIRYKLEVGELKGCGTGIGVLLYGGTGWFINRLAMHPVRPRVSRSAPDALAAPRALDHERQQDPRLGERVALEVGHQLAAATSSPAC